jgi:hypothetical protein
MRLQIRDDRPMQALTGLSQVMFDYRPLASAISTTSPNSRPTQKGSRLERKSANLTVAPWGMLSLASLLGFGTWPFLIKEEPCYWRANVCCATYRPPGTGVIPLNLRLGSLRNRSACIII